MPGVAKLCVLLVTPAALGMWLGTRLVERSLACARETGYRRVALWTTDRQVSDRRIYEHFGFTLTAEAPHHGFGQDLVSETCDLGLGDTAG
jgi:GNAT superfamily N-acetyltransferase